MSNLPDTPDATGWISDARTSKRIVFSNLSDFIHRAESVDPKHAPCSRGVWGGMPISPEDEQKFQAALTLARRGWPEGARHIQQIVGGMTGAITSITNGMAADWNRDVAPSGSFSYIDPVAHTIGLPDPWWCRDDGRSSGADIIRLTTNVAASAICGANEMFMRGAVVCAVATILEAAGKPIEIWQGSKSHKPYDPDVHGVRGGASIETQVCLKRADEIADYDTIAFMLAHPAAQRRLVFSVREENGFSPNMTSPTNIIGEEGTIVLNAGGATGGGKARYDWLASQIREACAAAGVEIPESAFAKIARVPVPSWDGIDINSL